MSHISRQKRLLLGTAVVAGLLYLYGWRIANALVLHFVGCGYGGAGAVYVDAVDARTGAFLPAHLYHESTLIVRDDDYVDSTSLASGGAGSRAGTYDVVVRVPGYREWRAEDVAVPQRICNVRHARLTARLEPLP